MKRIAMMMVLGLALIGLGKFSAFATHGRHTVVADDAGDDGGDDGGSDDDGGDSGT